MHVDSPRTLQERRRRIGERFLDEHRLARKPGCRLSPVNIEFVLALDRHIDPRLRRMKVEMAWSKLHSVPGLDRREIRQHAPLETVGLDRTRVYRVVARAIVATPNH